MPASSDESPASVTDTGSMVIFVFAFVAPAPSMMFTSRFTSLSVSSGSVAVTTSVEKLMPVVEHGSLFASISVKPVSTE